MKVGGSSIIHVPIASSRAVARTTQEYIFQMTLALYVCEPQTLAPEVPDRAELKVFGTRAAD